MPKVHLLDYVAGNIRSLVNAIEKCGYEVEWIKSPEDVKTADVSCYYRRLCTNMDYLRGGTISNLEEPYPNTGNSLKHGLSFRRLPLMSRCSCHAPSSLDWGLTAYMLGRYCPHR